MCPSRSEVEFFQLVNPSSRTYEGPISMSEAESLWKRTKIFGLRYPDSIGNVGVVVFGRAISFTFQQDESSVSFSVQLDPFEGGHRPVKIAIYSYGCAHPEHYGYACSFGNRSTSYWVSTRRDEAQVQSESIPEDHLLMNCSYHEVGDLAYSVQRIQVIALLEALSASAPYVGLNQLCGEVSLQKKRLMG